MYYLIHYKWKGGGGKMGGGWESSEILSITTKAKEIESKFTIYQASARSQKEKTPASFLVEATF